MGEREGEKESGGWKSEKKGSRGSPRRSLLASMPRRTRGDQLKWVISGESRRMGHTGQYRRFPKNLSTNWDKRSRLVVDS